MSAARAIGLVLGVAADGALGDPRRRPPVTAFRRLAHRPGVALVAGAAVAGGLLLERAGRGRPLVQASATAVTTWAVLGAAGLALQGTELARDLEECRFDPARSTLSELDPRVADGLGADRAVPGLGGDVGGEHFGRGGGAAGVGRGGGGPGPARAHGR